MPAPQPPDEIVPAPEPEGVRLTRVGFIGKRVVFDLRLPSGARVRKTGRVVDTRWLGLTRVGRVPEAELTIEGPTGARVTARVSADHVQPV